MTVQEICGAHQRGISLENKENNYKLKGNYVELTNMNFFSQHMHMKYCEYPKTGRRA